MLDDQDNTTVRTLLPGHYTLKSLAKGIEEMFAGNPGVKIPTKINQPNGAMIIENLEIKKIVLVICQSCLALIADYFS